MTNEITPLPNRHLELLPHDPRDHVALGQLPRRQRGSCRVPRHHSFEGDLHDAEDVGHVVAGLVDGAKQHEEAVRGGVRHEEEVVGGVAVVRRNVECHHPLEQLLRRLVVREERVPLHAKEGALVRVRQPRGRPGDVVGGVEAEELVEPRLDVVPRCVSDGVRELDLAEGAAGRAGGRRLLGLVAELRDELEGQGAARAFVAVYCENRSDRVRWMSKERGVKRRVKEDMGAEVERYQEEGCRRTWVQK